MRGSRRVWRLGLRDRGHHHIDGRAGARGDGKVSNDVTVGVFVCNIPGHYGDGMRGTLTVK